MSNVCLKCEKELSGAKKSAIKGNGDFYLACAGCGNVHLVTTNGLGLTEVKATIEGTSDEAKAQMIEAKELFAKAGYRPTHYIAEMNDGQKRSADELVAVDYEAVKDTAKESVKEVVKSIANSIGVKGIDVTDTDAEKIAGLVVKVIKGETLSCGCGK